MTPPMGHINLNSIPIAVCSAQEAAVYPGSCIYITLGNIGMLIIHYSLTLMSVKGVEIVEL